MGLRHLMILEAGWQVCGEVTRADEVLELAAQHDPHLVVISSQQGEDLTLIRELGRRRPGPQVLVVAHETTTQQVHRALKAGALGYVMLGDAPEELMRAVTAVCCGSLYVSQRAAGGLMQLLRQAKADAAGVNQLSDREMEIFRLIRRGLGTKEIAASLGISVKTVETHKQRMKEKLRLATCAELNQHARLDQARAAEPRREKAANA